VEDFYTGRTQFLPVMAIKWRTSTQVELNFYQYGYQVEDFSQVELNFYQYGYQVEDSYTGRTQFLPEYQSSGGLLHRWNSISTRISIKWKTSTQVIGNFKETVLQGPAFIALSQPEYNKIFGRMTKTPKRDT
jgi:hypothetical protein